MNTMNQTTNQDASGCCDAQAQAERRELSAEAPACTCDDCNCQPGQCPCCD